MLKKTWITTSAMLVITLLSSCSSGSSTSPSNGFTYPATETVNATADYFGTIIADPYQWLESTTAPNVLNWVDEQNRFTQNYFDQIPNYSQIVTQINQIYATSSTQSTALFAKHKTIVKGNGVYFYQLNTEINQHQQTIPGVAMTTTVSRDNIIYVTNQANQSGKVFLDLNKMYPGDVIQLKMIKTFDNGKYLVFGLSHNYGDLVDLHVLNVSAAKEVTVINNAFNEATPWESGFFYVVPQQISDPLLSSYNYDNLNYLYLDSNGKPLYDTVYQGNAKAMVGVSHLDTAESQLYFSTAIDTNNNLYRVDLTQKPWTPQVFIDDAYQHSFNILAIESSVAKIITNAGATRLRLISFNTAHPQPANWHNILPATDSSAIINTIMSCGNKYITSRIDNGSSKLEQYSESGSFEHEINLPANNAVNVGDDACQSESQFLFGYSNLATPSNYVQYNPLNNTESIYSTETVPTFTPDDYEMIRVSVPSTGGASVNVFLAYKKGLQLNGNNPTYIYVYGGFDAPMLPSFDKRAVFFLEHGGVYAVAQVRGGGEQGTSWYNDGRLLTKQNTYNDTIAVAEYLINNKYTTAAKLGLGGRSNGGLTTAAVALQRPDLFQVAFPAVGVLDLLRYNQFTYGFSWYYDYGFSSIEAEFNNMLKFSPLQNVTHQNYPAMYIQTGQQDSRVPPLHSYKFAATLQNVAVNSNPYLLDSYPNLSHFPEAMEATEAAKTWAFFFYNTHTALSN